VITLLTDFGAGSEHVGALHAVLAVGCPGVDRVDLAHDLPPGDVRGGALTLARLAPLMPGAIHLAVIDPGVGTPRRAAAVALEEGGALVGPDNGLLGPAAAVLGAREAVALTPPAEGAATFHGRDLFAPTAARIACGARVGDLGEPFDPAGLASPDLPPAEVSTGHLRAPVIGIDRFGNVQLLAGRADLAAAGFTAGDRIFAAVTERRHPVTVGRVFADVAPKGMLLHIDSHGMVALAVNGGSAAERIGALPGRIVSLGRWPLK
jgi:S-adenosyl-L-methionine hydrolase (adenosine-forming)